MSELKLFITDGTNVLKKDLPESIQESVLIPYKPVDSSREYPISIESSEENWILKSNGSVNYILNGQIALEGKLEENGCYDLEIASLKRILKVYVLPDIETNPLYLSMFNVKILSFGSSDQCEISYSYNSVPQKSFQIQQSGNNFVITPYEGEIYLNGKRISSPSFLRIGDIIFINGIKMIYMRDFLWTNNPNYSVNANGMQPYTGYNIINSNDYEKSEVNADELELYEAKDYFYHTPRFIDYIEKEKIEIDTPPPRVGNEGDMPFFLTMGASYIMAFSTVISCYSTIYQLKEGTTTIQEAWPSLFMTVTMLIGMTVFPTLMERWRKKHRIKLENKRQKKYNQYLDEKEKEINNVLESQKQKMLRLYPNAEDCYNILKTKNRLWERKITDRDFLHIRLGIGNCDANIEIDAPRFQFEVEPDSCRKRAIDISSRLNKLSNVPITTSLLKERISAIIYDNGLKNKYLNNLILQIITEHSALDLKIVFLTDNSDFSYVKYLPHIWSEDKSIRLYGETPEEYKNISTYLENDFKERQAAFKDKKEASEKADGNTSKEEFATERYKLQSCYYLIITDCYDKVKNLQILDDLFKDDLNYGYSLLVAEGGLNSVPLNCNNFIYVKEKGSYLVEGEEDKNIVTSFETELSKSFDLNYLSSYVANIPISAKKGALELPTSLSFLEMYNVSKIEQLNILNRWKEHDPTTSLKVPIGVHADRDLFTIDLHEKAHGPHGLIAGSTGSGKSEFIITFVLSMALNYHPYEVQFVLIDYKGGGLAGAFENREKGYSIPHLAGTITNLDKSEMNRTLVSINSELKRRQSEFNKARDALGEGTVDIYKYQRFYREGKVKEPISHLFLIADEFAELKQQQPDFMDELVSTARIGRSLGVHLILATQKPTGVVDEQITANSKFRICLKVQDKDDSLEMIRRPDAAKIKEPGRFYLLVGYDEYFDVGQSGWSGAKYIPSNRVIKKIDDKVTLIDNNGNIINEFYDDENTKLDNVEDLGEQLPNIVRYMVDLAKKNNISTKMLWLSAIPDKVYTDGLKNKYDYKSAPYFINPVIGEYDNPSQQQQGILTLNLTNIGNTAIYGMSGSGKENLLTTIIYDSCVNHSPEEVNFYVCDFGAETLKMFNKFPHVGGIATIDDVEMFTNLFGMMYDEMSYRKQLFMDYAGSYVNYIKESGKKLPLIVVVINGFDNFSDQFSNIADYTEQLIKEGAKYGIVVIATSTAPNGIGYRLSQMFGNTLTMQQKSSDTYEDLVSAPRNTSIKSYFGRGLVSMNKTAYEFQTAYFCKPEEIGNVIRKTANELIDKYETRAKKIKTLPKYVTVDLMENETTSLDSVAIGINKATLNPVFYNFDNLPCSILLSTHIFDNATFYKSIIYLISRISNVKAYVFDMTGLYDKNYDNVQNCIYNDDLTASLRNVIMEVNKESDGIKRVFFFLGIGVLKESLDDTGKSYYEALFNNANKFKNSKFIFIDDAEPFQSLESETWYDQLVVPINGIWVGDDFSHQSIIDLSRITDEQEDDEFEYRAFVNGAKQVIMFKHVVENDEGDDEDGQ